MPEAKQDGREDMDVTDRTLPRISPQDLDGLMGGLEIRCVALTECLVESGYCLTMGGANVPGIHYNLAGHGRLTVRDGAPIELRPHTLVIVPPNAPFRIDAAAIGTPSGSLKAIDGRKQYMAGAGEVRRVVAGQQPDIILICGFFDAQYGCAVQLFGTLAKPIVEQFDGRDGLDHTLKAALSELVAQEVGAGAMSAALMKQVIVALLRRSLHSASTWVERFAMLSDPKIARALAEMVAHPGGPHSVSSLAESACLSRSAFMARFTELVGESPMSVLRGLRMRQAAQQLLGTQLTVDKIAYNAGYESRSSFVRAFRKAYETDPSDYRASPTRDAPEPPRCPVRTPERV